MSFLIYIPILTFSAFCQASHITCILAPAGDQNNHGTIIDDTYERTITLQWAYTLQTIFEEEAPNYKLIIGRKPGEVIAPLTYATNVNREQADLLIALNVHQQDALTPKLFLYHSYAEHSFKPAQQSIIAFTPLNSIHALHSEKSKEYALFLKKIMTDKTANLDIATPWELPLAISEGVNAPVLVIDIGIHAKDDWKQVVEPLTKALKDLFYTMRNQK